MESYLRALAPELNEAASASIGDLFGALADAVAGASGAIYPSGSFFNYFKDGWNFAGFPTSATPTYPDSLITTVITLGRRQGIGV